MSRVSASVYRNNEKAGSNRLEPKGDAMEMKLELVLIPVTDVDRAKTFYVQRLGFVEDVDVQPAAGVRVVQLTPAGSACSIGMGTGLPAYDEMAPGTIKGLHLVVADIEQARAELVGRGVEVGAVEDVGGGVKYAGLADPDGNTLTLQEMAWRTGDKF
jgi:predicted enzyme related to lactoylglutathione lyase